MWELRSLCLQAVLSGELFGLAHHIGRVSRELHNSHPNIRWLYGLLTVSIFIFPEIIGFLMLFSYVRFVDRLV
jgi:hypothetical protein